MGKEWPVEERTGKASKQLARDDILGAGFGQEKGNKKGSFWRKMMMC
jgi:hypothetical protein